MALHDRIDELRTIKGMTVRALAAAVGVHESQASRWLSGKQVPGVTSVLKLARALGVSVDLLLREPTDPPEDPHSAAIATVSRLARTLGVHPNELVDAAAPELASDDDPKRCMVVRYGAQCRLRRHGLATEHAFGAASGAAVEAI